MGFNFRKSVKIAPGIRLNVGKKGISSVSIGPRGAKVNIGKKGTRTTVSAPGTGLSYSKYSAYQNQDNQQQEGSKSGIGTLIVVGIIIFLLFIWIF